MTFFISDLHLGHKKILELSPKRGGTNIEEHDDWIIESWNSVVGKNDMTWTLGDVAFSELSLAKVAKLNGHKKLCRGNHDNLTTSTYLKYFNNVYGIVKQNGFWLSHAPIHTQELRGLKCVHGHTHHRMIQFIGMDADCLFSKVDDRYINVCVEKLNGVPISIDQLKERL